MSESDDRILDGVKETESGDVRVEAVKEELRAVDRFRSLNEELQGEVVRLVAQREAARVMRQQQEPPVYPVEARLRMIGDALCELGYLDSPDGIVARPVPAGKVGDFSVMMPALMEPGPEMDRPQAMANYRDVILPKVAAELGEKFPDLGFSVIGIYLNVEFRKDRFVEDLLNQVRSMGEGFGDSVVNLDKSVVVDFSSPNTAKTMHVGHLRSTVIGQIIKRLLDATGATTYGVNHLGDWGTQFGQLTLAYDLWAEEVRAQINPEERPVEYLAELYRRVKGAIKAEAAEGKSDLADRARALFADLERFDERVFALWEKFRRDSLVDFERMYDRLGIDGLEIILGESFYEDKMDASTAMAKEAGIVAPEADGSFGLSFVETIGLEAALDQGMVEKSENGEITLKPDTLNVVNLRTFNLMPPDGVVDEGDAPPASFDEALKKDVVFSYVWKRSRAVAEKLGMKLSGSGKRVSLIAEDRMSIPEALKAGLLEFLPVDKIGQGTEPLLFRQDVAEACGLLSGGKLQFPGGILNVDLDSGMKVGLFADSSEAGAVVLRPDVIDFTNLDQLNDGDFEDGVNVSMRWTLTSEQAKTLGIELEEGSSSVDLATSANMSVEQAIHGGLMRFEKSEIKDLPPIPAQRLSDDDGNLNLNSLPSTVFVTADGRTVYITRDLAAICHRIDHFHADEVLYVIGNEQSLHMAQLAEASRRIGKTGGKEVEHVVFGMINDARTMQKISSREGAGGLSEFLDELAQAAADGIRERERSRRSLAENRGYQYVPNVSEVDLPEVAEAVAVGSLIFSNVNQEIHRDMRFDPDKAVSVEGQTGPYIQYTCVRLESLLEKCGFDEGVEVDMDGVEVTEAEYALSKTLADFSGVIQSAANNRAPNVLAKYLLDLAGEFNNVYASGPKVMELEGNARNYLLQLYAATNKVLRKGLYLLNVPVPKCM